MKKIYLFIVLLGLISSLNIACNKKTYNQSGTVAQGGQDSGGGDTLGSNYGDIEAFFESEGNLSFELHNIFDNLLYYVDDFDDVLENKNYSHFSLINIELSNSIVEKFEEIDRKDRIQNFNCGKGYKPAFDPGSSGAALCVPDRAKLKANFDIDNTHPDNFDISGEVTRIERDWESDKESNPVERKGPSVSDEDRQEYKNSIHVGADKEIAYHLLYPLLAYPNKIDRINSTNAYKILKKIEFDLRYDESCKDLHGNEKSASVSSFDLSSIVCVDIKKLAKIPKDSLKKQIHALLIHEILHMLGFGERDALIVQKFITKNYDEMMKVPTSNSNLQLLLSEKVSVIASYLSLFLDIYSEENFVQGIKNKDPQLKKSIAYLEKIGNEAKKMLILFDEVVEENNRGKQVREQLNILNTKKDLIKFIDEMKSLNQVFDCLENCSPEEFEFTTYSPDYSFIRKRLVYFYNKFERR